MSQPRPQGWQCQHLNNPTQHFMVHIIGVALVSNTKFRFYQQNEKQVQDSETQIQRSKGHV